MGFLYGQIVIPRQGPWLWDELAEKNQISGDVRIHFRVTPTTPAGFSQNIYRPLAHGILCPKKYRAARSGFA